jgi:hypothetical protein
MIKLRIGFYLILVFQMYLGTMVMKISDTVDKQRSSGAKIAGFGFFNLKPDRYAVLHQNNSYLEPNGISGTPPLSRRVES